MNRNSNPYRKGFPPPEEGERTPAPNSRAEYEEQRRKASSPPSSGQPPQQRQPAGQGRPSSSRSQRQPSPPSPEQNLRSERNVGNLQQEREGSPPRRYRTGAESAPRAREPYQPQADMRGRQPAPRTPSGRLPQESPITSRQLQSEMQDRQSASRTPSGRLPQESPITSRQLQSEMQDRQSASRTPSGRLPQERPITSRQLQSEMQDRQPASRTPSGRLPQERPITSRQLQSEMQERQSASRAPSGRLPQERPMGGAQGGRQDQRQQAQPRSDSAGDRTANQRMRPQAPIQQRMQPPAKAGALNLFDELGENVSAEELLPRSRRGADPRMQQEEPIRQRMQEPVKAGVRDLFGENDKTEELSAKDRREAGDEPHPKKKGKRKGKGDDGDTIETESLAKDGKKDPKTLRRMILVNFAKSMLVVACICIITVSVMVVFLANYIVTTVDKGDMAVDLDNLALMRTSYFEAIDEPTGELVEYQKLSQGMDSLYAPLTEIPETMQNAVIASEDTSFLTHRGFNLRRTIQAALNQVFRFSDVDFGASTIDQQLVKNVTGDDVVTDEERGAMAGYERKIREIYLASVMNHTYSKAQIMEGYLNSLPLSGQVVGVKAAAKNYFDKDPMELTIPECATIAGITKAPGDYDPWVNPDACRNRRNDVLALMFKEGFITDKAKLQEYYDSPLGMVTKEVVEGETVASGVFSYFSDAAFKELIPIIQEMHPGLGEKGATLKIYTEGYRFELTVDLKLQKAMEQLYALGYTDDNEGAVFPSSMTAMENIKDEKGKDTGETKEVKAQSAMAVVDYEGRLRGIVGGVGPKTESRGQNRAYDSTRSIGSTVKPIGPYVLGIDWGVISYSTRIADAPSRLGTPVRTDPDTGEPINSWPSNYSKTYFPDPILAVDALTMSLNTVPVIIGDFIGPKIICEFLRDTLMVSTLVEEDENIAPMALGSMEYGMSPMSLAGIYQIMGNGGQFFPPRLIERIRDAEGNVIWEAPAIQIQAIDPGTSFIMNKMMANVLGSSSGTETARNGTANGMKPAGEMAAAAKTGTTDDHTDRWVVGLTPYYVSAVWWGFDYSASLQRWPNTPTQNPHMVAWKRIMEQVQADMPYKEFPSMPENVEARMFCRQTGGLATDVCTDIQEGYYRTDLGEGTVAMPVTCSEHGDPNEDPFGGG